jgi:predicted SprT family Zn-dependent metalloprotease
MAAKTTKATKPVRKTRPAPSNVRTKKPANPAAITPVEYGGLQAAFSFLNEKLFDGALPNVFITYQRRAHSGGYFSPDRFTSRAGTGEHHEIALNPDGFVGQTDEFIVSILVHEMTHEWQQAHGKPPSRGYHDKEWAAKMERLGLMPSTNGMVGGKRTGQQMQHYVIPGGAYAQAFAALAATGWKLNLQSTIHAGGTKAPPSKVKFTCLACGWNVWGKPDSEVVHKPCGCDMLAECSVVGSYDKEAEPA